MGKLKEDLRPLGAKHSWARTPGTYIAGQAAIDGADQAAVTAEAKWGAGRLRLIVPTELREKFDRQRYLLNRAIWHGDLEAVQREAARMISAWRAMDITAEEAGAPKPNPGWWEVVLEDGTVAVLLKDSRDLDRKRIVELVEGRRVVVYTLEEIGRVLSHYSRIAYAKQVFPGATVEAVRHPSDPFDVLPDSNLDLDDEIPSFANPLGH